MYLGESVILTGGATRLFLHPFTAGVNSQRKEFAPLGANSFL